MCHQGQGCLLAGFLQQDVKLLSDRKEIASFQAVTCGVGVCSGARITFLALKGVAAVSRLAAGLAERHCTLSTRALGLAAGTEVAGAAGRDGGAAATWGGVTPSQDRILGAGRYLQRGAHDPGTPQLLWKTDAGMDRGYAAGTSKKEALARLQCVRTASRSIIQSPLDES